MNLEVIRYTVSNRKEQGTGSVSRFDVVVDFLSETGKVVPVSASCFIPRKPHSRPVVDIDVSQSDETREFLEANTDIYARSFFVAQISDIATLEMFTQDEMTHEHVESAQAVLHHFGETEFRSGGFREQLVLAISKADNSNLSRLSASFPEMVWAWKLSQLNGGIQKLKSIASHH